MASGLGGLATNLDTTRREAGLNGWDAAERPGRRNLADLH